MAKGDFFIKLDIDDWLNDPCLRGLKRENRDTWLTACLLMHREGVYQFTGLPSTLARKFGLSQAEFDDFVNDLRATKTASVTLSGKNVTVKSRRFAREAKRREKDNLRKKKERGNKRVTPESQESHDTIVSSYKLQAKEEGVEVGLVEQPLPPERHPAVVLFEDVFGPPGTSFAKQVATHVKDLGVWRTLLRNKSSYADEPKQRQGVPKWILNAYDEAVAEKAKLNGKARGPTARDFANDAKRQEEEFLREKGLTN